MSVIEVCRLSFSQTNVPFPHVTGLKIRFPLDLSSSDLKNKATYLKLLSK